LTFERKEKNILSL